MKLMILGYAGHGKDTVCEMLKEHGFSYRSTSMILAERVIMPRLPYPSVQECFEDRKNHRAEWYDIITEYNEDDPARFIREVYQESDIYCGCRSFTELSFARKERLFDFAVWVDASERLPVESTISCTVNEMCADFRLSNNSTLTELRLRLDTMVKIFRLVRRSNG